MKANRLGWLAFFLLAPAFSQMPAESKADRHPIVRVAVGEGQENQGQRGSVDEPKSRFAGVPLSDEEVLLLSIRAGAEKRDPQSEFELGRTFFHGHLGVATNRVEAVRWFRKAAEQNYTDAQLVLGACYLSGEGVPKDETEGVKWFRKAADQNYPEAQDFLGFCYATGLGVAKDKTEAVKWHRKSAEQNYPQAQYFLGHCYADGEGVAKDEAEAVKWYRKAAEQNFALAQWSLGICYARGEGVGKDTAAALKWYRKAAEQNFAPAQWSLGICYARGEGVAKDYVEAVKWFRKAADQNFAPAQWSLGICYARGEGVAKDYVEAYKWDLLASAQGDEDARREASILEDRMTRQQIAEGQELARNFKPREVPSPGADSSAAAIARTRPESSGTGFFITEDGYLITNQHVVGNEAQVRLVTKAGLLAAKVVKFDAANDLALLKVDGKFAALPLAPSRTMRLGSTVATVGFPNIGLQGFAPKLAKGEIAALSGAQDDPRFFQISVPVQPGNSGGALVDDHGNVVGVVAAKLDEAAAFATTGALPQNVNYAIKSTLLLSFLESVPDVSPKLREPSNQERRFEDVVKSAENATVLVLVY